MSWDFSLGLGSMGGGIAGAIASARQAKKNRAFQRAMVRDRFALTVEGAQKANVNPLFALGQTGAAPGGAMAQIGNPVAEGVNSAISARRVKEEVKNLAATRQLTEAQKEFVDRQIVGQDILNSASSMDNVLKAYDTGYWMSNRTVRDLALANQGGKAGQAAAIVAAAVDEAEQVISKGGRGSGDRARARRRAARSVKTRAKGKSVDRWSTVAPGTNARQRSRNRANRR
jgi:hypothetical protein